MRGVGVTRGTSSKNTYRWTAHRGKYLLYISTVCLPLDDWLVGGLNFLSQQFVPLDVLEPCVLLDFLEAVVAQPFMGIPLQQSTNEVEGLLIIKVGRAYIF